MIAFSSSPCTRRNKINPEHTYFGKNGFRCCFCLIEWYTIVPSPRPPLVAENMFIVNNGTQLDCMSNACTCRNFLNFLTIEKCGDRRRRARKIEKYLEINFSFAIPITYTPRQSHQKLCRMRLLLWAVAIYVWKRKQRNWRNCGACRDVDHSMRYARHWPWPFAHFHIVYPIISAISSNKLYFYVSPFAITSHKVRKTFCLALALTPGDLYGVCVNAPNASPIDNGMDGACRAPKNAVKHVLESKNKWQQCKAMRIVIWKIYWCSGCLPPPPCATSANNNKHRRIVHNRSQPSSYQGDIEFVLILHIMQPICLSPTPS